MQLYHLYSSVMHTNTYLVYGDKAAFVVDPGDEECAAKLKNMIGKLHAKLDGILITHAHFDHIAGVSKLKRLFEEDDPKIYFPKDETDYISSSKNVGKYMGIKVEPFVPDVLLEGGESIRVAGLDLDVISTPGHTKGGLCYKLLDKIFTGDTIFFTSYGRTDLYDGDLEILRQSIKNLFALEGNFVLLPGHGEPTTLEFERKNNPILEEDGKDNGGADNDGNADDASEKEE